MVILSVIILVISMSSAALIPYAQQSVSSGTLQLGVWQLSEIGYDNSVPDFTFSTPTPSVLRIASSEPSAGASYIFIQFNRTDLDGRKLQVRWNEYYTYPDLRDLNILRLYVFDQAFDRREMSSYVADDVVLNPPSWKIACAYLEVLYYPGPLGAPAGWLGWRTDTSEPLNLSSWTSDTVTVLFRDYDAWTGQVTMGDFDWFKILDADNNEVYAYEFDGLALMEMTGTSQVYGLIVPSGEPVPTISVETSSSDVNVTQPGFCFTANIEMTDIANLYSYVLSLDFASSMLTVSGVELSLPTEWGQDYSIVRNETIVEAGMGSYSLEVTALYPAPAFNGSMTVATLNFSVTDALFLHMRGRTVNASLNLRQTLLMDNLDNLIPHLANDAQVTMSFPFTGDINDDGYCNAKDAAILGAAWGSTPESPNWNVKADLNEDGIINAKDAVLLGLQFGADY